MELLLKGWKGSQNAILLAGILLGCALQLGAAQQRVSMVLEPPNPQEGQGVTFSVRGGPREFLRCEWNQHTHSREPEDIIEYIPNPRSQERNFTARSSRETVRSDCSLHIANLTWSDTGNYSVIFEIDPNRQSPDKKPGQQPEFYEGSIYLHVSASDQNKIQVRPVPQQPILGQNVTLTLQRTLQGLEFCEWFKQDASGTQKSIAHYGQREPADSQKRVTVGQDCSLHLAKVTAADSGTYRVVMQVLVDRKQHQPGHGTQPEEIQEYWGQVELWVNQDSQKGKYSHAASLSYSAGIIAGALLCFFAWTDAFTSLFCLLCSPSSQPGRLL